MHKFAAEIDNDNIRQNQYLKIILDDIMTLECYNSVATPYPRSLGPHGEVKL